ncbi:MAG TPA: LytTR family DNA-binding domain-containing protein [Chitinophagales bacterium]|nr:LytTR family DNA-binding domain-containing protein [Chitinophagales bacterium]
MIKAIALDDEPLALKILESFCRQVDFISLEKTFTKPAEAQKYLKKFPADLLFLDIQMPSLSGLDFYKSIQQETMVIFTTAHSQFAVEGFNLSAVDFLLKPFTIERFMQAVNKANDFYNYTHQTEKAPNQFLFIRADYSLIKIAVNDILFIEGLDDYLKIHLHNQKMIVTRMTMKAIMEKLPAREFIRVHRSFIVPFSRIENVRNKVITVAGTEIPIGSSYEEEFFKVFKP